MVVSAKSTAPLNQEQIEFIKKSMSVSFGQHDLVQDGENVLCDFSAEVDLTEATKLLKKVIFIARGVAQRTTLFESEGKCSYSLDPLVELLKSRQVKRLGEGLFLFEGEFLEIFRSLNRHFFDVAVNEFNAIDQENPGLWPMDIFSKVNYLNEFPHQALLVSGAKQAHSELRKIADKYQPDHEFCEVELDSSFAPSRVGLQPAVCDSCYYALKNNKSCGNKVYTTYNKVFRNEVSDVDSLDRLKAFSVRDVMFVGEKNFVLHTRQQLIERLIEFFSTSGLRCKIEVADDPFFSGSVEKKFFQHQFELKYEILCEIPFLNKWIAVGSINLHLDTFAKAFDIKNNDEYIHSGCIGIGFERLLLALYSQFGLDTSNWPHELKKSLSKAIG